MTDLPIPYMPTLQELQEAHRKFFENEVRDIFYRAATELIERAWCSESSLSVAEAVAVLLQTWNQSYYRYHQKFDAKHFGAIEDLIHTYMQQLIVYRARSVESFTDDDEDAVVSLFETFEATLGPVGAAKTLHLLAPRFFPLWDRDIAAGYKIHLRPKGENGELYVTFSCYMPRHKALYWEARLPLAVTP